MVSRQLTAVENEFLLHKAMHGDLSSSSPEIADIAASEFSCVLHCEAAPLVYTAVAYLVAYELKSVSARQKKLH